MFTDRFENKKRLMSMCITFIHQSLICVRLIGLEPTRRETPDPKSGASTNFATGARWLYFFEIFCKDNNFI